MECGSCVCLIHVFTLPRLAELCDRSFSRSFGCSVVLSVSKAHERINRCRPSVLGMATGDRLISGVDPDSNVNSGSIFRFIACCQRTLRSSGVINRVL